MIIGIERVHHIAMTVPDLKVAHDFYVGLLGLVETSRKRWTQGDARMDAIVGLRGTSGELFFADAGNISFEFFRFDTPASPRLEQDRPVNMCGYTHFCLQVSDIHGIYERLHEAGMHFHTPPSTGPLGTIATYGRDPFGNVIELYQPPD